MILNSAVLSSIQSHYHETNTNPTSIYIIPHFTIHIALKQPTHT